MYVMFWYTFFINSYNAFCKHVYMNIYIFSYYGTLTINAPPNDWLAIKKMYYVICMNY